MKLLFLSRLKKDESSGGAYLRNQAIVWIYEQLGLKVEHSFLDETQTKISFSTFINIMRFGRHLLGMFKRGCIKATDFELLHLDYFQHFSWCIKRDPGSKLIYNAHNIDSELYFPERKGMAFQKFFRHEVKQMEKCDAVFVCSEREKEILTSFSDRLAGKVMTVPNLINEQEYHAHDTDLKKTILFLGSLDYHPNIEATHYLCQEFSQYVKENLSSEQLASFDFVIVGRNPSHSLKELIEESLFELRENASLTELKEILANTLISLVPLMSGSGTRLKILESLCSRAYVLSTPLGCEGIDSQAMSKATIDHFASEFVRLVESGVQVSDEDYHSFITRYDRGQWLANNKRHMMNLLGMT